MNRIVALSVLKMSPPRLVDTRVGDGRNGLPRGARLAIWGYDTRPILGLKALETARKCEHFVAVCIRMARSCTCRYIVPGGDSQKHRRPIRTLSASTHATGREPSGLTSY